MNAVRQQTVRGQTALRYRPNSAGIDTGRYDLGSLGGFTDDPVTHAGLTDLASLATSADWEDRVRAEVLRQRLTITLPDQFPCIYETPGSPNLARNKHKRPQPWVVSPDIDMLHALLADYQELWDSYTAQWGPTARRTFAVGRLDGVSPHGLYRPSTTPAQVIGSTMLTHTDMYRHAPERLRQVHPRHAGEHRG